MKVLIIDDQPSARTMLKHVVEGIGPTIRVSDFGSPVEALRWSEANAPDLVLLDYRMPEMDGLEFARRFRRSLNRRDVPIVLISVVGDEPVRQAALDAGVIDVLVKPVRPRELRSRCKNLLQLRQQGETVKERARSLETRVIGDLHEVELREAGTLLRLVNAMDARDPSFGAHCQRVSRIAETVARGLGWSAEEAESIRHAAPLHDIGKVAIGDAILRKRSALTDAELAVLRTHTTVGHDILNDSHNRFARAAAVLALHHHERWDGSGYPSGLTREEIPLPARIVAVADVFETLLSERPYKRAWDPDEALGYMRQQRGTLFDPACIDVLLDCQATILPIFRGEHVPVTSGA